MKSRTWLMKNFVRKLDGNLNLRSIYSKNVMCMNQKSDQKGKKQSFFDFAAEVGLTKHLGGLEATEKLLELCRVGEDSYILDVGCGAGQSSCFIGMKHGCRVVGVDINEMMIKRSKESAEREGVEDIVEFRVADAQDLPFDDDVFDAVISESVTAFPEDKQRAVSEYTRVTKPGGYVGLNEATWLKTPPPPDVLAWASQDLGASAKPLTPEEWAGLLQGAGLTEIVVEVSGINSRKEAKGLVRRYGYGGMLRSIVRGIYMYARNPAYRRFVKEVRNGGITPENLEECFGYGIYVGKKETH
ncbi:MAG: methyltransferase domain-containing protein [Candidatus Bathyarchaeota archaeon]|nr:methyltransferase domain-containing protein [Candidatus Bathyarchaeota archaeon]